MARFMPLAVVLCIVVAGCNPVSKIKHAADDHRESKVDEEYKNRYANLRKHMVAWPDDTTFAVYYNDKSMDVDICGMKNVGDTNPDEKGRLVVKAIEFVNKRTKAVSTYNTNVARLADFYIHFSYSRKIEGGCRSKTRTESYAITLRCYCGHELVYEESFTSHTERYNKYQIFAFIVSLSADQKFQRYLASL